MRNPAGFVWRTAENLLLKKWRDRPDEVPLSGNELDPALGLDEELMPERDRDALRAEAASRRRRRHGQPRSASRSWRPGAHRGRRRTGALPPYSPDLNPIELAWSKIKTALRAAGARTVEMLIAAINFIVGFVTPKDAAGWFKHSGVLPPPQPA